MPNKNQTAGIESQEKAIDARRTTYLQSKRA
jgi:hypothetical protein